MSLRRASALAAICIALTIGVVAGCGVAPTAEPHPTSTPVAPTPQAPLSDPTPTPEPTPAPTPMPAEPDEEEGEEDSEAGQDLPFDPQVARGTLSNGMSYYIRRNQEPQDRAQIALAVRVGSVFEEESERGLAHFVEHMAFNGTERFAKQEIVEYLESLGSAFGPDLNAYTSFDETLYFLEIPTDDPEVTETAFQILSDWAYAISFDPEEVELERGVVLEEWRLSQGFSSRLQDNLLQLLFGSSRYATRAPIGLTEIIENATAEDLRAYYERWYRPDLMAVVAVGDFEIEDIRSKIKHHFAPPPEGDAAQERAVLTASTHRPIFDFETHDAPRVEVFTDAESPGSQFVLIRKLAPETGRDLATFRRLIVEQLAYMMLNTRLFERTQSEDPPFLAANAGRSGYTETLDIVTFGGWMEQGHIETGLGAMLEEMQSASQHGFTESELAREKSELLSSVERAYKQREQTESGILVNEYLDHFFRGTPAPGIEAEWELYQQLLPQITLAEFDAVVRSWTETENTALLIVRPEETEALTDEALASAALAQIVEANSLVAAPYEDDVGDIPLLANIPNPGSIVSEEPIGSIDAVKWTLSNGVTVIAKQTDFKNDEVVFRSFSPGGRSLVSDEDHVSAQFAAQLVTESGVGPHDRVTLDKLLAGKRVSASPYIWELFEGVDGSASPEDMETLFQLITLYATEPRLDPAVYSNFRARLQSIAEFNAAEPDQALFDRVNSLLSQGHLRERPLSVELLNELDMDRARAVYADRFEDISDSTFVFVGAFDWDELRSLSATYLASLPGAGRMEEWVDHGIDPPTGLIDEVVRSGVEPRSNTVVAFAGEMEWDRAEDVALEVAGEILGIRLRERVREQLGGSYSISVFAGASILPDQEYLNYAIFGSDPERTEELFLEVIAEIEWLQDGGEQSYLDTAKEILRTARKEQVRENRFWLNQILDVSERGESFGEIIRFDELLDALTLEEVSDAAEMYFPTDRYLRVTLYPVEE